MAALIPPLPDDFREIVSHYATGICVVTCVDAQGVDHAMTANSFVSVSLEPLLVSICVERGSRFHSAIAGTDRWAVSILTPGSEADARWFATKGRPLAGQLDRSAHHEGSVSGAAVLDDALAVLECTTWATYDGGDHEIVVGQVRALELSHPFAEPTVYFRRAFRRLVDPSQTPPVA